MLFNPDVSKSPKEVIFSKKKKQPDHPSLLFNNALIQTCSSEKHLGLILDEKLNFKQHLDEKISKSMKIIGVIKKLRPILPRHSLISIYKSFVRPHLDYGDVIYDQPNNHSFSEKIESIQFNSALAITGAIRGSSREKLYNELGFESLKDRRWMRRLCYFYKIFYLQSPTYLANNLPSMTISQRYPNSFSNIRCRTTTFQNSFFPYSVSQWNQLNSLIRNCKSYPLFRNDLLKLIKPPGNNIYGIHDPLGIKLLCRLRLGSSHLREHKFRHNFQDTLNPMCSCTLETETTAHFLLRCRNYDNLRLTLMSELNYIDSSILLLNDTDLVTLLMYGTNNYNANINEKILKLCIDYIKHSLRFDESLF